MRLDPTPFILGAIAVLLIGGGVVLTQKKQGFGYVLFVAAVPFVLLLLADVAVSAMSLARNYAGGVGPFGARPASAFGSSYPNLWGGAHIGMGMVPDTREELFRPIQTVATSRRRTQSRRRR